MDYHIGMEILSVDNMRKSDKNCETPSRELMYKAGEAIFNACDFHGSIAVVCGSGNNAGDGYVLATLLNKTSEVTIYLTSDRFSIDGKHYYEECLNNNIEVKEIDEDTDLNGYDMIVDCIFGIGFHGMVKGKEKIAIEKINESSAYVISVDINSGLNGDTGLGDLIVESDLTCSIGSYKPGHFLGKAKDVIKNKINLDIGIKPVDKPYRYADKSYVRQAFKQRLNYSHKGSYGRVCLIGGCFLYTGAIRLASMSECNVVSSIIASQRLGAGITTIAIPRSLVPTVSPMILESTIFPLEEKEDGSIRYNEDELDRICQANNAIAFGMGISQSEDIISSLRYLLKNFKGAMVIDADGLNCLSKLNIKEIAGSSCMKILTPHLKEFSRLTGYTIKEIEDNPVELAKEYALKTRSVVLLKGPTTIITDCKETYLCDRGCPGMASGGSGDVLSGVILGILGYNDDPLLASVSGAYINGLAGELAQKKYGPISQIASDTVKYIPEAILSLTRKR